MLELLPEDNLTNLVYQFKGTIGDEFSAINDSLRKKRQCFVDDGSFKYDIIIDAKTVRRVNTDTYKVKDFRIMLEPIDPSQEFSQIKCSNKLNKIHTIKFCDNSLLRYYALLEKRLYIQDPMYGCTNVGLRVELVKSELHITIASYSTDEQRQINCKHNMNMLFDFDDDFNDIPYLNEYGEHMMGCIECCTEISSEPYTVNEINRAMTLLTTVIDHIKINADDLTPDDSASLQKLMRHILEFEPWVQFYDDMVRKVTEIREQEYREAKKKEKATKKQREKQEKEREEKERALRMIKNFPICGGGRKHNLLF